MTANVLAGDIGGTNSRLALYSHSSGAGGPTLVRAATFPSRDHAGLGEVIARFLGDGKAAAPIAAAAFGIAGPVVDDAVVLANCDYRIRKQPATSPYPYALP